MDRYIFNYFKNPPKTRKDSEHYGILKATLFFSQISNKNKPANGNKNEKMVGCSSF